MPEKMEARSTSYGALVGGDVIVDKSGNEWLVIEPNRDGDTMTLWLADPATKVKAHHVTKSAVAVAKVMRPKTHAEKVAEAETEVDAAEAETPTEEPTPEETVAAVEEGLDAEVVAEETAAEHDARVTATEESPVVLPTFEEMTDLEKRSHLYLVHGVYAADVKFREKLVELHDEAHGDDRLGAPHEHVEGAPVPTESDES